MQVLIKSLMIVFLVGCTSTRSRQDSTARSPSSAGTWVLTEVEFGDTVVYLCEAGHAVVVKDPNECGKAKKEGRTSCTESALMSDGPLTRREAGDTLTLLRDGVAAYELKQNGSGEYIYKEMSGSKPVLRLKSEPATSTALKFMASLQCG